MITTTKFSLAYCDYIASKIKDALQKDLSQIGSKIAGVGSVRLNLDPEGGWMVDTSKKISVIDTNGKHYQITIKEIK